jgi:cyanophycinase
MSGPVFAFLGSGEFLPWTEPVDRWLLSHATRGTGRVLVVPTASAPEGDEVFTRWATQGVSHYAELGIESVPVPLRTRDDANSPAVVATLEDASMVFFSGGNPAYLAATLAGTVFWNALVNALVEGMAYAGCSAGIACLGDLAPDSLVRSRDGQVWKPGLGLFPGMFFGPHWNTLESFAPGATDYIVASVPPGSRLLAVDENTAVVGDGVEWQVMGSGGAYLLEEGQWREYRAGESFEATLNPVFA